MAKWEEKDPRWLVEHREDGANVNGWHWNESSKLEWAKAQLISLLGSISNSDGSGTIEALVKTITGEASVSTRKGNKKMALFDLTITLSWTGKVTGQDDIKAKGEIKIEEFMAGTEEDDWLWSVTVEGSGTDEEKAALKKVAEGSRAQVMAQLNAFIAHFISASLQ